MARFLRDPPADDRAHEQGAEAQHAAIPLPVPFAEKVRVGAEVVQHGGHDDGGDLCELQVAAQPDLAGRLEAQERDGDDVDPVDVLANVLEAALDGVRLHEDGAEEDDGGLDEEGGGQGAAAGGLEIGAEAGEEKGAEDEADERGEGLGPAVGPGCGVEVGGADAEKHGVPWSKMTVRGGSRV